MSDLDTLRPEVREARTDLYVHAQLVPEIQRSVGIIGAELLRLAHVNSHLLIAANEYQDRAEKAEAELAALKARIADALIADVRRAPSGLGRVEVEGLPHDWIDMRVRLVVENDNGIQTLQRRDS